MTRLLRNAKLAPVLLLALLAVGTAFQVACSGQVVGTDDATQEDDLYGYGSYGYGQYGGYRH